MLEPFYHDNRFDFLNKKTIMKANYTYESVNSVCENLIEKHMPFHIFNIVWNHITPFDRYIYEEVDYDEEYSYLCADFVTKGAFKKKNRKKPALKVGKAYRLVFWDDEC